MTDSQINYKNRENELLTLLERISKAEEWVKDTLLTMDEYSLLLNDIQNTLDRIIDKDSRLGREYEKEKRTTHWTEYSGLGYVNDAHLLNIWKIYIQKLLEQLGRKQSTNQVVIPAGGYSTARSVLRSILRDAKTSIFIFDEYLDDSEILDIIQPYIESGVQVKLLKASPNNAFKSDVKQMRKQFGNIIFLRDISTKIHDRFIILDNKQVYTSGDSFKNLGHKLTVISKIESGEAAKCISSFDSLWAKARVIY